MKKKFLGVIALTLAAATAMTGCSLLEDAFDFIDGLFAPTIELKDEALGGEKVIDFANGADSDVFFESDGWSNGDVFNTVWTKDNVKYENGVMSISITEEKKTAWVDRDGDGESEEVEFDYTAGEARSQLYYGYGDYEVRMKPSANAGTASTFFTCTGNYDLKYVLDENGDYVLDDEGNRVTQENPHDEIDIEFLGQDTTHVQFNYFVNGVGGHEYMYDLGFDASKEFHEYGFRWEADAITWFVDDVPVYKVTTDKTVETGKNVVLTDVLPSTAGRMLANYWCGTEDAVGWMGKYVGATKDNGTQYQWVATSAVGAPLNPAEKVEIPEGEEIALNVSELTLEGNTDVYTATKDEDANALNVQYANIAGASYQNINWNVAAVAATKNVFSAKITNNGTETVTVRIDVNSETTVGNTIAANVSATQDGVAVYTDVQWGGSTFTVEAGAAVEVIVVYDASRKPTNVMIYCDSSVYGDTATHSGNVTFSELAFSGEYTPEGTPDQPEQPEQPAGEYDTLAFTTEVYTITPNNTATESLNVSYEGISGGTYKNVCAQISDIGNANNTFSVTIKNNGTASVRVRVDIKATTQVGNTNICNVSATGAEYTDTDWGGTYLTVGAGAEVNVVVTYDPNSDRGAVTELLLYFDTSTYEDTNTYSGNVTISNFKFSKVEA